MLTLQDIELRFGQRYIFKKASATISSGECIGLVGPNGAGKTTLLKILAGLQGLDSGSILRPKNFRIGYLPQDGLESKEASIVLEIRSAAEEILSCEKLQHKLETELQIATPNTPEHTRILHDLAECDDTLQLLGRNQLPAKIETILIGLGFKKEDFDRYPGELSGGWQMRLGLAKLLLQAPDLLLLDEPTNHLDLPSQRWLEKFLVKYNGAVLMVSHDRAFLDALCGRIFEVHSGEIHPYTGNYTEYESQKAHRELAQLAAFKTQEKNIAKTQAFIDRFRSKATKAAQVQSRIKALEKIDRITIEDDLATVHFKFPEAPPCGQRVLTLENISYGFNEKLLFNQLNAAIERGEKIGIVGPNGAGKSTLLRLLAGEILPQQGTRTLGHQVEFSYFAQHQADALDPNQSVLETVSEKLPIGTSVNPRSVLGALLFTADDIHKPVRVLSGGEKNRLALAKILLNRSNLLFLDEPTNHLDMASKKVLQEALISFKGAVVLVSHDRDFLDPLIQRVWEVSEKGLFIFHGNLSAYLEWYDAEELKKEAGPSPVFEVQKKSNPQISSKEARKLKASLEKRLITTEARVETLEAEKQKLEALLSDPEFFKKDPKETREAIDRHTACVTELEIAWQEWNAAFEESNQGL